MSDVRADAEIVLRLSRAEAIVLFEWLARLDMRGTAPVEDPSEEVVFWRIEGQLESALTEPLGPNYRDVVDAARRAVSSSDEGGNG